MKRHLVRAMFSGALVLGVAIISPTSVTATDDSGTTQYRPNVGVITREFGTGPLKIAKWAFRGTSNQASPTDAKLSLKVAKKSKAIFGISIDTSAVYRVLIEKSRNTIYSQLINTTTRTGLMSVSILNCNG